MGLPSTAGEKGRRIRAPLDGSQRPWAPAAGSRGFILSDTTLRVLDISFAEAQPYYTQGRGLPEVDSSPLHTAHGHAGNDSQGKGEPESTTGGAPVAFGFPALP